ncbi:hypothetical protein [Zunongwangia sp. H14]|uniref:hypothetical protein n=1 Tax=Zunongwangia sp. H14 TaxID=3240792 RepID=UPI0035663C00
MKTQHLSQFDRIKIFLNEYFFGYGVFFTIVRLIGGPLILIMGLNLYFTGDTKLGVGYAGFMIAFGIYYILKPLIIILTKKSWFQNFDLSYKIEPDKIVVQSEKSKSDLDYSDLVSILKRKTYYALRTKSKQGIYLPIKYLEPAELSILDGQKKLMATTYKNNA